MGRCTASATKNRGLNRQRRTGAVQSTYMRRLLITGIPGIGKTTIGDYLAAHRGFQHLNFEIGTTMQRFLSGGEDGLVREIAHSEQGRRDTVITWGFLPAEQLPAVLRLCELGYTWVWLDGDRDAARRAFLKRGDVPEYLLDRQLERIAQHLDLAMLQPRILNTFDGEGHFRPLDKIAAELLEDLPE